MGQTLTHGIYLPDEGERNCYNGLAANWNILDGAVGTVAEHTTALAGKAPLVHTHTKSQITDFPAYGTTAGTICEGNDSRLSNARTPVAHTHGKADITDLFNSANTWSEVNTFSKNQIIQAGAYFYNSDSTAATSTLNLRNSKVTKGGTSDNGSQIIQFLDKDNKFLSQITTTKALSGTTQLQFTLGNIDGNNNSISGTIQYSLAKDGTKQFIPGSDSTHNLGNSSYQWNNLYAKNYYYNGTAWGLDKANTWTQNQIIASSNDKCYYIKDTVYELGQDYPNGEHLGGLTIHDKNGSTVGLLDIVDRSYGNMEMRIRVQQKFDPNSNNRSTSGNFLFNEMILGITPTKTNYIGFNADLWGGNTYNLGTSTNKWKSLNGIDPGALSLPDYSKSMNVDTTGWSTSAGRISYTPTVNGWLQIAIPNDIDNNNEKSNFITIMDTDVPNDGFNNPSGISVGNTNDYRIQITFPIVANKTYYIYIKSYSGNILAVKYIAALGHI